MAGAVATNGEAGFRPGRASLWAHEAAIEAAQLIGRLRIETPGDAANTQRMMAGAR